MSSSLPSCLRLKDNRLEELRSKTRRKSTRPPRDTGWLGCRVGLSVGGRATHTRSRTTHTTDDDSESFMVSMTESRSDMSMGEAQSRNNSGCSGVLEVSSGSRGPLVRLAIRATGAPPGPTRGNDELARRTESCVALRPRTPPLACPALRCILATAFKHHLDCSWPSWPPGGLHAPPRSSQRGPPPTH